MVPRGSLGPRALRLVQSRSADRGVYGVTCAKRLLQGEPVNESINPRILVVGINFVMTWRVVQCLRAAGFKPAVLSHSPANPAAWRGARFHSFPLDRLLYEGPELNEFARRHIATVAAGYDVVLPADFDCTVACARLCLSSWIGPSAEVLDRIHNKWEFTQTLQKIGVPVPQSICVTTPAEWSKADFGYPLIAKPLAASDSSGVVKLDDEAALARLRPSLDAALPLIVQRCVDGWDIGVSVFAIDGEPRVCTMWDRPTERGRDFFWNENLWQDTLKVLRHFSFSGVAHFDLMFDRQTRGHSFLECNPRYWGSLLYSKSSGINFPALHVAAIMRRNSGAAPDPALVRAQKTGRVTLPADERFLQSAMPLYEKRIFGRVERLRNRLLPRRQP